MRWTGAARAATLLGLAPRQDPPADSVVVVDDVTGFTFGQYVSDNGISYRIALPSPIPDTGGYDVVLQVAAPIAIGWAGIAWGGSMTYNPLTIAWANGDSVTVSSREAFGYFVPPEYTNATYTLLSKGTHVNATHWQYTTKCTGCASWGDADTGITTLDAKGQNALAFAFSATPPDTPASNTSNFGIHDSIGHWYHDFGNIGNANFDDLVSKNYEGPGSTAAGGSTGTPPTSTPKPTATSTGKEPPTATPVSPTTAAPTSSSPASTVTSTGSSTFISPPCCKGPGRPTSSHSSQSSVPASTATPPGAPPTTNISTTASTSTASPKRSTAPLPFPNSCTGVSAIRYPHSTADGWKITKIAGSLTQPRTAIFDSLGNLLLLQSSLGISVHTFGPDGCINSSTTVVSNRNLNHGLTLAPDGKTLYATSMTTAWRWTWDPVARKVSDQTTVLTGMNNGGHQTRSIYVVPNQPNLVVISVGSNDNWDYASESMAAGRAAVKVFDMAKVPAAGYKYNTDGYQFGYGLRNEVGLVFDPSNKVWGVENGGDDFKRTVQSRATDIHNDNPAEELNYLGDPTKPNTQWYGYPTCHTVWEPSLITDATFKTGDQFVVTPNATFDDSACKAKATAPRLSFQAHSAPISAAFDAAADNMYISFHGSWDRTPPTGYKLVEVPFKHGDDGAYEPVAAADSNKGYRDILWNTDVSACGGGFGGGACFRPAAVAWDSANARLVVSSDATAEGELYILAKA